MMSVDEAPVIMKNIEIAASGWVSIRNERYSTISPPRNDNL